MTAQLSIKLNVEDLVVLKDFARRRYRTCWRNELEADHPDADLGRYLYEALIASNGTREAPLDYGVELLRYDWEEILP